MLNKQGAASLAAPHAFVLYQTEPAWRNPESQNHLDPLSRYFVCDRSPGWGLVMGIRQPAAFALIRWVAVGGFATR